MDITLNIPPCFPASVKKIPFDIEIRDELSTVPKFKKKRLDFNNPPFPPSLRTNGVGILGLASVGDLIVEAVIAERKKDRSIEAVSSTLILLPDELASLKDSTIPLEERNYRLRDYLLNCLLLMEDISPRLDEENLLFYAKLINGATMDDSANGANSELYFGTKIAVPPHVFFAIACHELEHSDINKAASKINSKVFSSLVRNLSTIESTCDFAGLTALKKVSGGDNDLFNRWLNDYLTHVQRGKTFESLTRKYGFGIDGHHIARAAMMNLFDLAKENGVEPYELITPLYQSLRETYESYADPTTKARRVTFPIFLQHALERLSDKLPVRLEFKVESGTNPDSDQISNFEQELLATNDFTFRELKSLHEEFHGSDKGPLIEVLPIISIKK